MLSCRARNQLWPPDHRLRHTKHQNQFTSIIPYQGHEIIHIGPWPALGCALHYAARLPTSQTPANINKINETDSQVTSPRLKNAEPIVTNTGCT